MRTAIIIIAAAIITGCAANNEAIRQANRSKVNLLSIGITLDSAKSIFGSIQPYRTETMSGANGVNLLVQLYHTDMKAWDGAVTDDELTPVVFKDNILIGWGWLFLDDAVQKYEIRLR